MSGSQSTPLGPGREQFIDAPQLVTVGELDECLDACACSLAGQRCEYRECQLSIRQRKPALDREPARPLCGGAWIGLRLAIEQREADGESVLEPGGRGSSAAMARIWLAVPRSRAS
jgi:hypothetical protein